MTIELSAVLIAKNEKRVITRSIRSLVGVNEIVVMDTGSTDGTPEIAEKLGAKVRIKIFNNSFHFAQARNLADTYATHDWVISIDADEILRAGMMRKIRTAIRDHEKATAFTITFTDRGSITHKIKIYRKSVWDWKYRVHEQLEGGEPSGVIDLTSVVMEHLPEPDKTRRHQQNVELLKMTVKENPEYTRAWRHLGQEYMVDKEWKEAIPYLATYIERTTEDVLQKSEVEMHLGECYAQSGDIDSAMKWFEVASATDPRRREPLYHAGWWKIKTARTATDLEQASKYLKKCVEIDVKAKPNSPLDQPSVWKNEPHRMIEFCADELRKAIIS